MKTKQTIIPVEIHTDYTHERGNKPELARQRIELSGFYLQSLFNSIKYLASALESQVEEKDHEYCYDLRNLSDIGYAVCNSIFRAASKVETSQTNDAPQNNLSIAEMLSFLINSEDVPEYISDGISQVMTDFFNDEVDQSDFVKETHSAAYIERLLNAQRKE